MKQQDKRQTVGGGLRLAAFGAGMLAALTLLVAIFPATAADSDTNAPAPSPYAKWIKPWAGRPTTSAALGGAELRLMVSTVRGEVPLSELAKMTPVERLYYSYRIKVATTEMATTGDCHYYFVSNTDMTSAPNRKLSADDLQLLDKFLAQLPDDHSELPPPGQRIVVQVLEKSQWHVHVYDGSKVPLEVKSIMNLLANPLDH